MLAGDDDIVIDEVVCVASQQRLIVVCEGRCDSKDTRSN